jgi:hypothetical protein
MSDARKAGRKELAYGCRRSEGAPQANEPKRSAHKQLSPISYPPHNRDVWGFVGTGPPSLL